MELPAPGPFIFTPPQPAATQPAYAFNAPQLPAIQFNAAHVFTPLTNVSVSTDVPRNKMRRVTKIEGTTEFARIPAPYESDEARLFKRHHAFITKYPALFDQLVALRTTPNEHELREEIVFDLIECDQVDEAFHFYLEMKICETRAQFLNMYYHDLVVIDQSEKVKALIATVSTHQPTHFEIFLLHLAYAYVMTNKFAQVFEIYDRLPTKKIELLYFIFRSKIRLAIEANPVQAVTEINQIFPQPIRNELFFIMGTALIKFQRPDLIAFFIDHIPAQKEKLIDLMNKYAKK